MNSLKLTIESFKENELSNKHKLNVYGGLTQDGLPSNEPPLDEELDENGNPLNCGPGPRGGGGTSSVATGSSKGETVSNTTPVIIRN